MRVIRLTRGAAALLLLAVRLADVTGEAARRGRRHFIALRDHEFVGEDPVLAALLRREAARRARPLRPRRAAADELARLRARLRRVGLRAPTAPTPPRRNRTRRLEHESPFTGDAKTNHLRAMQLTAAEQAMRGAEYNIKELDSIMKKYNDDPMFRIAYIFRKLDQWLREMEIMYSYTTQWSGHSDRHWDYYSHLNPNNIRVFIHVIYNEYMLRKNLDITYSVDYLLGLYAEIQNSDDTPANATAAGQDTSK